MGNKSEYEKEVTSIREGMRKLIASQQKDALKELSSKVNTLSKDLSSVQDELKNLLKEANENRERIEGLEDIKKQLDKTGKRIEDLRSIAEEIKKLDIRNIVSQIEELKSKIQFIETKQNLGPLYDHIQRLEKELAHMKASLPMVIE